MSESISKDDHIATVEAIRAEYAGRYLGAVAEIERLRAVTPDMVERALNAWFKSPPSETDQGLARSMRAALLAALTDQQTAPEMKT